MFPNIRLMIVATSASLLAVICAMALFMGMFAAFSVGHQPFSALPAGKPPLQIAYADELSAPVADGKPAPFGVRFQLNAPQIPNGPVIVAVPAVLDRAPLPDAAAPAEAQPDTTAPDTSPVPPQDDSAAQPAHDTPPGNSGQEAKREAKQEAKQDANSAAAPVNDAQRDSANTDNVTAALKTPVEAPVPQRPAATISPPHVAPEIRIVAREADNPASVNTSPAPSLARRGIKRHKLAVHLHQSHHFRRPRIHPLAGNQTNVRPNGFGQPSGFMQPSGNGFVQPGIYAQPNGITQAGFQYAPTAIKPKSMKFRRAAQSVN